MRWGAAWLAAVLLATSAGPARAQNAVGGAGRGVPPEAMYVGGKNPTNVLTGLRVDDSGNLIVSASQVLSNWSVNQTQWNGTTVTVASGSITNGTLRVALATDQPTMSNAQPHNLSQIGGNTITTASGSVTNATQRVVLATDQPALTNAQPMNLTQVGGNTIGAASGGVTNTTLRVVLATDQPTRTNVELVNLTQLASTNLVNAGLAGSLAVGGTAGNNAAINQNPMLIGMQALSTQPASATTGNLRQFVGSLDGALFVRPYGPILWSCSLDNVGTTLTQCQAAPGAQLKLYLTNVVATSTTSIAGLFLLAYGTGVNCGTAGTAFLPSTPSITVPRLPYPANTIAPTVISLRTPLVAAQNNAICASGTGTNTLNIQLTGFTAP